MNETIAALRKYNFRVLLMGGNQNKLILNIFE